MFASKYQTIGTVVEFRYIVDTLPVSIAVLNISNDLQTEYTLVLIFYNLLNMNSLNYLGFNFAGILLVSTQLLCLGESDNCRKNTKSTCILIAAIKRSCSPTFDLKNFIKIVT